MTKLKILASLTLAGLIGTSAMAQADQLDDIRKAGKIRVATSLGVAPYTFVDAQMQPTGSDVETAKLIAEDLGVELEIVPTTVPARIPTLQSGKADVVISVLAITPERQEVIDFSKPYAVNQNVVMAPKTAKIAGYPDLAKQAVGVTRGTIEDKAISEQASDATIRRYEDVPTLITAVVSRQVDIATGSLTTMQNINRARNGEFESKFTILNAKLGIGLRKDNPQFKKWLDSWVDANLENGKLNAIYRKYNDVDLPVDDMKASN